MDDIERIQEMVAEGRISPEDGERLIAVLRDIDAADFALDSAASQPPEPASPESPLAPEPAVSPPAPPTPARPSAASELPEVAATSPLLAAATESIERRRERFEEYEKRRLERLHRDALRRQQHAQRELDRLEREAQRESERASREADRTARLAHRHAERDLSGERERLKETVRIATQAANEAAREVARRAQEIGKQAAEAAHAAAFEATQVARDLSQQATGAPPAQPRQPAPTEPAPPVEAAGASEPRVGGPASQRRIAPAGTRWVTAEVLAGDFVVQSVPGLTRPEVDRPDGVSIVETDYGFLIKQAPDRGSILDRFLAHARSVDMKVRIPADHGLNLRATAGDIDLRGVKYLQGRVTAGDIKARGVEGIDFTTMAGEVDVELKLVGGDHALTCSTGDLEVTLTPDSHVTIDGSVSIGEAHASHPALRTERRTLGERLTGTLGGGTAALTLRVTTGELAVKVEDQDRSG